MSVPHVITHKLLVTGSHEWDDLAVLQYELHEILTEWGVSARQVLLIEGECHAGGADIMARDTWWSWGGPVRGVPANWTTLGKKAGVVRNQLMVDMMPDLVIGFLQGDSRGTKDCLERARAASIATVVVRG